LGGGTKLLNKGKMLPEEKRPTPEKKARALNIREEWAKGVLIKKVRVNTRRDRGGRAGATQVKGKKLAT